MNITLVGMPGSGKSYIGKRLAEKLNYDFLDLDTVLEQEFDLPLQKILDNLGEKEFLKKQAQDAITHSVGENKVISPGGSIVYTDDAMRHLNTVSTIVYLEVDIQTLKERIGNIPRGIVGLASQSFEGIYQERIPLYKKWASVTINGVLGVEKIIRSIEDKLRL